MLSRGGDHVAVVVDGGLANQLFQRVAAFVIGQRTQRRVRLNSSWLGTGRRLGVTPRHLEIPIAEEDLSNSWIPPRIAVSAASRMRWHQQAWLMQRAVDDDALGRLSQQTQLVFGYFQNSGYVEEVWPLFAEYLKANPRTRHLLSPTITEGVTVHVRLGDYLSNPTAAKVHGVPDPGYYVRAIGRLVAEGVAPVVHLVSDEPEVACQRLALAGLPRKVDVEVSRTGSAWDDLSSIAGAEAVVMSNSSFSWWGAYLAHRRCGAPVIFPRNWFAASGAPSPPFLLSRWVAQD